VCFSFLSQTLSFFQVNYERELVETNDNHLQEHRIIECTATGQKAKPKEAIRSAFICYAFQMGSNGDVLGMAEKDLVQVARV
jgi:hypothetical protein